MGGRGALVVGFLPTGTMRGTMKFVPATALFAVVLVQLSRALPTTSKGEGARSSSSELLQVSLKGESGWYLAPSSSADGLTNPPMDCHQVCNEADMVCNEQQLFRHDGLDVGSSDALKGVLYSAHGGLSDSEVCPGGIFRHGNSIDDVDHVGKVVTFAEPAFNSPPVVIAGPLGYEGTDDATAEVVDITNTGFKLRT